MFSGRKMLNEKKKNSVMTLTNINTYILVIAHPDDESMFFLPTLHNLLQSKDQERGVGSNAHVDVDANAHVHINVCILCLSNGNYDGLGKIREKELADAVQVISLESRSEGEKGTGDSNNGSNSNILLTTLDHPKLQDGPNNDWNEDCIESVINDYIQSLDNTDTNTDQGTGACTGRNKITLITFDQGGVSGHVNHVHTCRGVMSYFHKKTKRCVENDASYTMVKEVWLLQSISNPIKKYFPFIPLMCLVWISLFHWFGLGRINDEETPEIKTFQMLQPRMVWRAMKAHESQFVWYRRLFVVFSRYSYVNDLIRIRPMTMSKRKDL